MAEKESKDALLSTVAVIAAGGSGLRMESERPKQFMDLDGRPLLAVTLEKFQVCHAVDAIVLVAHPDYIDYCKKEIVGRYALRKVIKVIAGGKRRQDSVRLGIEATKGDYGLVIIHDAVRPLVHPDLIERVVASAKKFRAVIAGLPAKETIKEVDKDNTVVRTYDRASLWHAQTPQAFYYEDIKSAHKKAVEEGWAEVTDDALLLEKMGLPVKVVKGSEDNIKITTLHDLELARFLWQLGKG
ncbi:MAG: 2-C-methyl-D-erythritol 4-phosphate cytidylyltransferase [Deltaproteobacteria bacterium]|nr:2-C-methyl-D-erythritol 4-phosphate cytidylyltransferase [Deltaproteobacteria bacterium]MBW1921339.1 2-C-methyl-D-erythritol 4-phosphate cytidylyltransferase [Deltaproteobacteria bacterium]MBW1934594.1 2-C-methyl-D-erythritol 4-phosphate cytidylyltransferase [Deltaproteobacteria bacterium]MBW1977692.1 2-C-methyl-D-erythritol 4-phosphate cytidylyltransferase [Deltaproteobacteria bacterium]MBW2045199.1 2-C-methyl-D-erythritol 4-phosphate cytidylyltransferase [Deltaproteobacteria bacterium]